MKFDSKINMKKLGIVLILVTLTFANVKAQKINWVSFEEAIELQQKKPKKIMMDMYTVWCGPCKMLDRNTFQNKDVANYVNANYYAVKFNAEGNDKVSFKGKLYSNPNYNPAKAKKRNSAHQLARYFRVSAYPTIIFLDENSDLIHPLVGYQTPQKLELYLKMFKKDDHKDLSSQEAFNAYFTEFKAEFKQ